MEIEMDRPWPLSWIVRIEQYNVLSKVNRERISVIPCVMVQTRLPFNYSNHLFPSVFIVIIISNCHTFFSFSSPSSSCSSASFSSSLSYNFMIISILIAVIIAVIALNSFFFSWYRYLRRPECYHNAIHSSWMLIFQTPKVLVVQSITCLISLPWIQKINAPFIYDPHRFTKTYPCLLIGPWVV